MKQKYRRNSSEKLYEDILERFKDHKDIGFAYPTQRVYNGQAKSRKEEY